MTEKIILDKPIIIGFAGAAGSGKDTISDIFKDTLNFYHLEKILLTDLIDNFNEALYLKQTGKQKLVNKNQKRNIVHSFSLGDPLKEMISFICNIPLERFYDKTKYTEDYVYNIDSGEMVYLKDVKKPYKLYNSKEYNDLFKGLLNKDKMGFDHTRLISIREIMVYIGNYLMCRRFSENIYCNKLFKGEEIQNCLNENKIIIVNDIRFDSEVKYLLDNFEDVYFFNIVNKNKIYKDINNISETGLSKEIMDDYFLDLENTTFPNIYNLIQTILKEIGLEIK